MKNNTFKKWFALSALFVFMCFSPHGLLRAQSTANYAFSTNTTGSLGLDMNGNTVDMSSGTTQVLATNTSQDQVINATAITFPAGFEFYLGGSRFTSYFATSNGLVQLGSTAVIGGATYTAAGGTLAAPRLTAFCGDLGTGTTGGVFGKLIGSAPNRCYVIEFRNMSLMWTSAYPNNGTYQVRFYEGTGVVEYVYGAMVCGSTTSAGDATPEVGFSWGGSVNQSASINISTSAVDISGTIFQNTIAAGNITNLNSAAEGSRRVYRFTPPAIPVAPTSLSFTGVGASYMTLNWVDNSTTEFGFVISRSLDGITYTNVGVAPANATSYLGTGLSSNTLYYWNVTALSEGGVSSPALSGTQSTLSCSPISGIKTVGAGGDYPNLTTAFSDINNCTLSGNTELQLIAGYPASAESYPIQSSNAASVGAFNLKIYPTVSGLSITSANTTGTLNLNNAKNITFDGRVNQVGASDLVISNTNVGASYAVQFVNDATSNTLQYLTLHSANNSTSSGTIVFAGSTGTTGNDNNLIDRCDIRDGAVTPLNGIYSSGTSTTVDNSGNTVSNSNIYNYFGVATASNGILLASNSSAWTINADRFYQTATRSWTGAGQHRGINIITSSGNGYVITNNIIGYASSTGTGVTTYNGAFGGRFFGIELTASNTGTASSIQGNTISGVSVSTTSGTTAGPGVFAGISVLGGTVSVGNITPNTIGAASGNGAISVTSTTNSANAYGIHASSTGTLIVSNNVVGSINATGATAGVICGIIGINTAGASTATTVSGNTIGGATANSIASGTSGLTTAASTVSGIATAGASSALTVSGNTINNLTNYSSSTTAALNGIVSSGSPTVATISNNTVSNTSLVSGTLAAISTASPTTLTVSGNTLFNAAASGATATINGISTSGATTGSIFKNKIYNLNAAGATSAVNGILASGGTTVNIYNNVIGDLKTPTTSAADPVRGISITSTSATTTYRVYYNSIYLNASSSGTNFGSTGVYHTVSATATTAALDMRNNIIINESTPAGTGITAAFRRSGVALGNFASTSNRNLLYAGVPSATRLLMYDGTNSYQTIIAYQTAVAPREVNSFEGEALFTGSGYGTAGNFFIGTTPSASNYLTPVAGITTQAESGAINITTPAITDDYASVIRAGNAGYTGTGTSPDVGAFEFAGTTPTPVITLNSVTPPASTQCTAAARLVSVNITTASGTITGANLTYSVNGTAQTPIVMTNSSGSTWTATIPVPTPGNATIAWGVVASNSLGLNGSYLGATYADEPLTGVTANAVASSTTICAGSPTNLSASLIKTGNITLGTGSLTTSGSGTSGGNYVSPFSHYFGGYKAQYVIRASELTAAGLSAGNITALSFDVTTAGTTYNGFSMDIAPTASTVATGTFLTGTFTNVYSGNLNVATTGLLPIIFATPFNWDGTSNIIVQFCWSNNNGGGTAAEVKYDATSFVSQAYYRADNQTPATICGTATATSTQSNRPRILFTGNAAPAITSVNWLNGATSVGTGNPLTVNPTVTTTYTANITSLGCVVSPAPTVSVTVNPLPSAPTATNSAQCGVQIPTASVTSTSGLPTPSFNWYAASTGGSALQTSTSTTYTSTVAVTTTFYVSELNTATGCESARTPVTVNVSTPDAVSLTSSVASICVGGSFTLTAANTNPTPFQSYTYSTVGTTGSGAETPIAGASISVTPTAAGTYTYTVTATDGGCAASATATVLVNGLPVIASATATPATVCSGNTITLTGNVTTSGATSAALGTATTTEFGGGVYRNGFGTGDFRHQLLYTAAEMTAAGFSAGSITSLTFNVSSVGSGSANNYTIKLANVPTAGPLTATFATGTFTTVYSAATYTAVGGNNTHTFSTPFAWDGTSNILVDICYNISATGGSSTLSATTPAVISNTNLLGSAGACSATGGATTYANRPLIAFTMNYASNFNWLWSPGTGLTTPVATTSITNTSGSPVNQAFTVTVTNPTTGCVASTTTPAVTINSAPLAPVANNSTQCGTMTPTASVTGTGTPGNTFSWYTVANGGTALAGQTANSLSAYPVSATTTFYVSENNATCSSTRTAVTVTVTTPPAISIAGTTTICNGSSTALTVSSPNDPNYTYSWSGGLGTGATVTASPTANTTYTVTATDASGGANNGCITTATTSITVNPLPQTFSVTPATAAICNGAVQQLTVPVTAGGTAILGTGTTAPGTTSFPNPLSAYYGGTKHQILFTAAELTAQGLTVGSKINSLAFDLNAFAANACTNFTIRMGNTALTALTGFVGGTTTVYGPTTFTPSATGLVTFTLVTPYTWDGTSNIVVETVHNAGNGGNGSGTRTNTTTTAANTVFYGSSDNVGGGIAGFDALSTWGTSGASNLRPNMRFVYTNIQPTWSPATSLYTDAGATTSYVAGTPTSSVYAKPTTTTTYVATFTGANGCTAQQTATITVNQPSSSTVTVSACDTYTWTQNGATYTTSGTHTAIIPNAAGCDSTITLNLTIKNSTSATVAHTACDSYTWPINGTMYTTSGTYTATIMNAAGCDSVITLNLTINHSTSATVNHVACQTYTWPVNGATYTTSGTHTATIMNAAGCDSVITLNLTIGGPSASSVSATACSSYTWAQNGMTYNASGAYNDTITNIYGCDSVITLNLTINQPTTNTVTETECTSYTWAQNGMTYTASGMYNDTIPNAAGCDSIITLDLTIIQPTTSSVSATSCSSYTWAQNGMTYTASGAYTDTIPNGSGCDSIITLNLTITTPTSSVFTVTTCSPSYTWAQNGTVYNASGMYNDTITNAAGCDSVVTLNLTITNFVATATDNGNATITASAGTTYQWINCTTNTPIAGANAQTFVATVNGTYAVIVSNGTCSDTSNCVNITNVGIKENTISTISVHPNPTHDVVIVTMDASSAIVEVMDVQGKLVQTTQIKSGGQVDLSAYERGVYTLRIKTELGTSIERIVKN